MSSPWRTNENCFCIFWIHISFYGLYWNCFLSSRGEKISLGLWNVAWLALSIYRFSLSLSLFILLIPPLPPFSLLPSFAFPFLTLFSISQISWALSSPSHSQSYLCLGTNGTHCPWFFVLLFRNKELKFLNFISI